MSEKMNTNEGLPATPSGSTLQVLAEDGSGLSASIPKPPAHEPTPWKVEFFPSRPMGGSRGSRGDRYYAQAFIESSREIPGAKSVHNDGSEHPVYREVCSIAYADWEPEKKAREEANALLIVNAVNSYYPSREIIEKLVKELGRMRVLADTNDEVVVQRDLAAAQQESARVLDEARAFLNKNVKP